MRTSFLVPITFLVAACGFPHPPPHGPVPPPPREAFAPAPLLAALREDFPEAKLDPPAPGADAHLLTFGKGPAVTDVDAFVATFLRRHAGPLAAGPLTAPFVPEGKASSERVVFGAPLRDSGCRRVRLGFALGPSGSLSMHRSCQRFRKAPPSYTSRPLPSTANGPTDLLVRVGALGGIAGPLFVGFVIDRFGDVYTAADSPGPTNREPAAFLGDYVKTLPPSEVEQFAFDVSLVAREKEEPESAPAAADLGAPVVQAFVGPEGRAVNLTALSASPARRAAEWARASVGL